MIASYHDLVVFTTDLLRLTQKDEKVNTLPRGLERVTGRFYKVASNPITGLETLLVACSTCNKFGHGSLQIDTSTNLFK